MSLTYLSLKLLSRTKSALDAWQAVFGSTAEISDKPAGTCFAKVAVAYDGQRSPLVTDAAFLDCTVSHMIGQSSALRHLSPGYLAPSCVNQTFNTPFLFIG